MGMIPINEEDKERAFQAIAENGGLLFATIRRNGDLVPVNCDEYGITSRADTFRTFVDAIAAEAKRMGADVIAGGLTGGAIIASAAAYAAGLRYVLVRKEPKNYSQGRAIDGTLTKGDKVVLVDDFFLRGEMTEKFKGFVEQEGAQVIGVLTYGKRDKSHVEKRGKELGVLVKSIYTYEEILRWLHQHAYIDQEALELTLAFIESPGAWQRKPRMSKRAKAFFKKHGTEITEDVLKAPA